MKRALVFVMLALGVAGSLAAQTELYSRYASQRGVTVAAVTNFALDSVSAIDVTAISATTDSGWVWMKQEFQIAELAQGQEASLRRGNDVILFARRDRHQPGMDAPIRNEQIDVVGSCYMGISYLSRTVYIFCSDSESQSDAIATLLVKKMMSAR